MKTIMKTIVAAIAVYAVKRVCTTHGPALYRRAGAVVKRIKK